MTISKAICSVGIFGLLISTLVFPASANAASFPGRNGQIAFSKEQNGSTSIWSLDSDGADKRELAKAAKEPVWSPSGSKVAFIDTKTGNDQLKLMNADGTNQRDPARGQSSNESSLAWSADGSQVAFVRTEPTHGNTVRSAVMVINVHSSIERNVSGWMRGGMYGSPSWSPDGAKVIYEKNDGTQRELIIAQLRTGIKNKLVTLSDNVDSHVSWSPSGKKILYSDTSNEVYTIWTDGSHRAVISDGDSYDASWSPDGKQIAFLEDRNGDEISISQEDGTVIQLPIQKETYRSVGAPVWSPDGTKLAFTLLYSDGTTQVSDIFTRDLRSEDATITWLASGNLQQLNWQAVR